MKGWTDTVGPGHNLIIKYITTKTAMTKEAILGPTIGTTNDITRIIHDTHTQVLIHIILAMTLHTTDYPHTGTHQLTQEIAKDYTLGQPTGQPRKPRTNLHQSPEDHKVRHLQKGIQESKLMTHTWTFTLQMTIQVIQKRTQTIYTGRAISLNSVLHEWGAKYRGTIIVTCIMDCPTITVHAGKRYKALITSGAAISLLRYSMDQHIDDCVKTPIQPTTAKVNTTGGSPMTALGMTELHLRKLILSLPTIL